jgi:hypothetical protein
LAIRSITAPITCGCQVRGADRAAGHQLAVDRGGGDLAGLAAHRVHPRVERRVAAARGVERQRAGHHRRLQQALGHEQAVQRQCGRHLGAVDQRQALFRGQRDRLDAGRGQRGGGIEQAAVDPYLAHAQHCQRHVRQRRQVARGADRALRRDRGHDPGVVQRHQRIHDPGAHAGIAARQAADLRQEDQAHHVVRQQLAGAHRVRQDQVALQLLQLVLRDMGLGQDAEAGIDAVGRIALGHDGPDRGGRGFDRAVRVGRQGQRGGRGPGRAQVCQRQCARLQRPAAVVGVTLHGCFTLDVT